MLGASVVAAAEAAKTRMPHHLTKVRLAGSHADIFKQSMLGSVLNYMNSTDNSTFRTSSPWTYIDLFGGQGRVKVADTDAVAQAQFKHAWNAGLSAATD